MRISSGDKGWERQTLLASQELGTVFIDFLMRVFDVLLIHW